MRIIEKIEIKYFRSFADNPTKIYNLKDINIFSWGNDSGKSNILRALNLFFNDKVDHRNQFNFNNDFSIFQSERIKDKYETKKITEEAESIRKSSPFVEIKIYFSLTDKERGSLPKNFWISRRWTSTKIWVYNSNIKTEYLHEHQQEKELWWEKSKKRINKINSLWRLQTLFIKNINFFYVPAIKDSYFFSYLYGILWDHLAEKTNKKLTVSVNALQEDIQAQTKDVFEKFKESTGLDAGFLLESNVVDFRRSTEVTTSEGTERVLLRCRGDGIQARLIPDILRELTSKSAKKHTIWGFEEPENSYEYRKSLQLAKEFYDKYSKKVQLFITTHSKEFLSIKDPKNTKEDKRRVSIYRIIKKWVGESEILFYDEKCGEFIDRDRKPLGTMEKLENDLWIIDHSRIIAELEEKISLLKINKEEYSELQQKWDALIVEHQEMKDQKNRIEWELQEQKDKNRTSFFCEWNDDKILNNLMLDGVGFIGWLNKTQAFDTAKEKNVNNPKAIIDKDFLTVLEAHLIKQWTNVVVLDYYCIENYLYHPDNLEEYLTQKQQPFNKDKYKEKIHKTITEQRNNKFHIPHIYSIREKHYSCILSYLKNVTNQTLLPVESIEEDILSEDFERYFPYLSMKENKSKFSELNNLSDKDLSQTVRFKEKIQWLIF